MVARCEFELARHAPAPHFPVVIGGCADGNRRVRQVRNVEQHVEQARLDIGQAYLEIFHLLRNRPDVGQESRRILAFGLQHSNLFRQRVATRLQFLGADLDRLAFRLQHIESVDVEFETARPQTVRGRTDVLA
jgi:hypothetical protein